MVYTKLHYYIALSISLNFDSSTRGSPEHFWSDPDPDHGLILNDPKSTFGNCVKIRNTLGISVA
jgi:hypothetical protein